jgi:hypothetical protein
MMTKIHKKVEFKGEIYWRNGDNISPLDHFDENGSLLANPFSDISYAVVFGNEIKRYGEVIGTQEDLKDIND